MQEQISEILIYIKGTLKYKWFAVFLAWMTCLIGWGIVMGLPNKYTSVAKVHVDSSTMLEPLLQGMAIHQDSRMIVRIMKQLMFTTPNLEKIIQLSNLDLFIDTDIQRVELYTSMKKDIKITGGNKDSLFEISYEANDPNIAKKVVTTVLSVFSEQTQLSTIEDMSSSQRFIENQISEYEIRLRDAEKAREAFKRTNFGLLPEEGAGQMQILQTTNDQLETAKLALREAISKRNILNIQMKQVIDAGDAWETTNANVELSPEDQKINVLELRKSDLLLKYTKNHPAVVTVEIALKDAIKSKKQKEKKKNLSGLPNAGAMANPYVQELKISINQAEAEVASFSARVSYLKQKIKGYNEQLNSRLSVETQMQNLNRDYETVSNNYQQLVQRREQARMSEKVDAETVSIKFKITDPPSKPLSPSGPKRLVFFTVVLIVGLGLGFGLSFFYYYIKPTYMTTRQLREETGLPVLGAISIHKVKNSSAIFDFAKYAFVLGGLIFVYMGLMGVEYLKLNGKEPIDFIQSVL